MEVTAMCTAVTFKAANYYFGRNMDIDDEYTEQVIVTPRKYPLVYSQGAANRKHYAMIGMGQTVNDYPLYYDATNECGLSIAALNFERNADYVPKSTEEHSIASYEVIPYLLAVCKNVKELKQRLRGTCITDQELCEGIPPSPLHWFAADEHEAVTIEQTLTGLRIYDNEVGVLTNNPPFDYHLHHLVEYMNVSSEQANNRFAPELQLETYSRGMGGIGLPGDCSSSSRFVRAAFVKWNALTPETELESVAQFFHILSSVEQQKGCIRLENGKMEYTSYSSCCNTQKGIYYYKTYNNSSLNAVDIHRENLDCEHLISYDVDKNIEIAFQN